MAGAAAVDDSNHDEEEEEEAEPGDDGIPATFTRLVSAQPDSRPRLAVTHTHAVITAVSGRSSLVTVPTA